VNAIFYTARILICALLCSAAASAFAQTAAVTVGSTVKPIAPLPLQQAPPQGYFSFKGDQIGTTTTAKTYTVIDKKTVPTLFGQDTWLQVQNKADPKQTGWIYTGSDAKPYQNVGH